MEGIRMNKKTLLFIIILVFAMLLPRNTFSQNGELLKVAFLLDQERYEDAFNVLNAFPLAMQAEPAYFEMMGEAALQTARFDLAISSFTKLSTLRSSASAYYQLARAFFMNNQKEEGYNKLSLLLETGSDLSIKDVMADEAFEAQTGDRDWIRFWSAVRYTEKNDLIAEARAQLKQKEPDANVFDILQRSFPDEPQSWFLSGQYFELINNSRRAESSFLKAISLAPEQNIYKSYLARYYAYSKRYTESCELISNSLKTNPLQSSLWMLRITNHLDQGDNQEAMKYMQYLEGIGVESQDLWMSLAKQMKNSDIHSAIGFMDKVIDQNPLSVSGWNYRAELYCERQNYDMALIDWAMSLDVNSQQPEIYFKRALIRHQIGDSKGACHDWKRALRYGHRKALNMIYKYCD